MAQLHTQEKTVDYTAAGASRITRKQMRAGCGSAGQTRLHDGENVHMSAQFDAAFSYSAAGRTSSPLLGRITAGPDGKQSSPAELYARLLQCSLGCCAAFPGGGMLRCGQKTRQTANTE